MLRGCPGTKAELSRKRTRLGPDSGTKTEVSRGNSPKTRVSEAVSKLPQQKTPGQGVPYRESLGLSPRFPWDISVFVPEFSSRAALRGAAQALRLPRCHANRCVRIKEACVRRIARPPSLRLTGARARSTIPLAWAKKGSNDPFRHRIKRDEARRDPKGAKRPMREWG